ncbi:MAG: metallophosphoesterase [Acidimicrobiales bacterium]
MKSANRRRASIVIGLISLLSVLQLAGPASAQPAVPTGLRVTAATSSTVSLSWNANAEPNIAFYEIYRTPTNGVLGDLVGTSATTAFTDTGLNSATTYWYYLKASDGQSSYRSGMVAATTPDIPNGTRLIAFGDMASCDANNKASDLGALLDVRPGTILALGDLAYPNGSDEDFQNCFSPSLGRHKARMLPAVGNHEYYTPNAAGYVNYFGTAAGPADKLYYETWIGGWQVLVLNSNCSEVGGCNVGSPQYTWLQQRIAAAPANVCRIAAMHHPRWASYAAYADQAFLSPLYQALYDGGTDLILTGHAHHYERFSPQNAQGQAAADGFQLMIVGTGGVPLRATSTPAANPRSASSRTVWASSTLSPTPIAGPSSRPAARFSIVALESVSMPLPPLLPSPPLLSLPRRSPLPRRRRPAASPQRPTKRPHWAPASSVSTERCSFANQTTPASPTGTGS